MATTRIDSKEGPPPSVVATGQDNNNSRTVDNQNVKISSTNNTNSPSPSRKSKAKRTTSSSFKGTGPGKPEAGGVNVHSKDDSSSRTPSFQRDDTVTASPSTSTQQTLAKPKEPKEPRPPREKNPVDENGQESRPRGPQRDDNNSNNSGPRVSSSSTQFNHHPHSFSHSSRGGRGGRGGGGFFSSSSADRDPTSSEPSDGTTPNRPYDSAARFAASSGGRGRGGYLSGHSSRGRGAGSGGLGRGQGGGDSRNFDGEDALRGRKPERRSQLNSHKSSTPDSAASKTGTPVTLSSKPDTTAKDPANNSNNAYKDGASTNDVPPTQRPSASSGVSEFKRTQQLVTRSPRSPRSPRRGFERGPETRQTPRENVRQENPPSAAGATLKTEGTSNMSSVALHTLDTIQSVDKPNRKSDAEFETPSLSTAETSITTSEDPQASSTNTSKKRKSARKNQKNDDEASSTISASSGKDTLSNSKSSATPAAATSGPGDRTAESAATDTTASDIKAQGESAWVPKSKANRTLPKERTGVSPGYLGKNPIPNFQKTQRPGQDSRQESQVRQRITHKDAPPTSTTQAADVPSKAANRKEHKDDTSKPSESGWGETSETPVASAPSAEGWGETSTSTLRWGEEVPWETQVGLNQLSTPTWVNESSDHQSQAPRSAGDRNIRDDRSNISDRPSQKHMEHGSGKDRSGTAINSSGDARYNGARFSPEYQQRGSHNERVNGTRDLEQERTFTSSAQSKDARSSLDKRNERLALQRGPHPKEYSKDDRRTRFSPGAPQELSDTADDSTADVGPRRPAQKADASSFGSSDVRRDSRYNNSNGREAFGSNTTRSNHLRSRSPPTPYQQKSQSSGFLASQDTNRNAAGKPTKSKLGPGNIRLPLLSTSLECQMSWQEMGLKPCVLESIKKAGLTRPSNTQKLMMKPFAEGKDVIAQSQSQNDRTNTLAMALLQKLSASAQMEKRCKAVVICSDGISPNKVHKDLEVWFESCPGLRCVFLTDPSDIALSDSEQAKQVVVTTLGPLMEVLNKGLIEMTAVETVMISMRSDELVGFDAFKQFWAMLPRGAQVVLMTGLIQPSLQAIKDYNFSANAAVVRADELTLQWSEHYYVDLLESALERRERQQRERSNRKRYPNGGRKDEPEVPDEKNQGEQDEEDEKDTYDRRWEILTNLLSKNPEISHVVIVTQSQSLTQALTDQLKEQNFPVLSIWSMADKTKVVKQFNRPDRCILVLESVLMENLDLDHYSLIINYEMPKRSVHYISSFGPFGRSGLRTTMINFCVTQDTKQRLLLAEIEAMHDIRIQKMTLQEADSRI